MAGKFITIEGGEGVGKTTLVAELKKYFERYWATGALPSAVFTREPGGTPEAEEIRRMLLQPSFIREPDYKRCVETEIFLFMAARAEHCHRLINPAMQRGDWVICDRYCDSTLAYQVAAAPDEDSRWRMKKFITDINAAPYGITLPNMTLVLTAPDAAVNERLATRYGGGVAADFIESRAAEYHAQVRSNYLSIVEEAEQNNFTPSRYVVLNNNGDIADLVFRAVVAINKFFKTTFPVPA